MIYLTVMGRCGNQMFQYAFARRLSEIRNDKITVNFGFLHSYTEENDPSFCDELQNFKASENYSSISTSDDLVLVYGSRRQKFIYRIYRRTRKLFGALKGNTKKVDSLFRKALAKHGIYLDSGFREKSFLQKPCKENNIFVRGYFEDPRYFDTIRDLILDEYTPLFPVSLRNQSFFNRIIETNSVCVSFRKWEVNGREICGEDYYKKAFYYIKEHISNPTFVIFSNDVSWVKNNFDLPPNCLFETGDNPIWEKILLMSSCKHFIITNSTFAWWAQYLGRYSEKVVVSPERWFEAQKNPDLLFDKNFISV